MSNAEWVDDESRLAIVEEVARILGKGFVNGFAILLFISAILIPPAVGTAVGMSLVTDMVIDGTDMGGLFVGLFTIAGVCFDLGIFSAVEDSRFGP